MPRKGGTKASVCHERHIIREQDMPAIEAFGVGMLTGVNLSESLDCVSCYNCYNQGVADFV
jgi:hypothetical protein